MDDSTTGQRLRKAIEDEDSDFSVRGFQEVMEERLKDAGVRGYTYPSINSYLHDETSPSIQFLAHAAEVLGVRHAWLATGHGAMTEEREEDRLRQRYSKPDNPLADNALLDTVIDRHPWLGQLTIGVQQTFMDVLRGLEFQTEGGRMLRTLDVEGVEEERLALADDLIFALTLPLRMWGVHFPRILEEEATVSMEGPGPSVDVNGYLRQVLGALATVMTTRTEGAPLDRRPDSVLTSLRRAVEGGDLPEPSPDERDRAERVQAALNEQIERAREGENFFEPESPWSEDWAQGQKLETVRQNLDAMKPILEAAREADDPDAYIRENADPNSSFEEYRESVEEWEEKLEALTEEE